MIGIMFSVKFFIYSIYVAIQFFNLKYNIITCINATKMFALNKSYNLFL